MYSAVSLTIADSVAFLRWCGTQFRAEGKEFEANMAANKAEALALLGSGDVALSKHEQAAPLIGDVVKAVDALRAALGTVETGTPNAADSRAQYPPSPSMDNDLFTPIGDGFGEPRL